MLQQTVIKAVLPVYERFLQRFPNVRDLAAADEESVRQAVRGLGYYRRFGMMHAAARVLAKRKFVWPTTYEGWKELPGIGDYTASAISSIAFDVPAAVLDGNVERVFARLLDLRAVPSDPSIKPVLRGLAQDLLAVEAPGDFNQALMELGQTVCTVSSPSCKACPVAKSCLANARGSQSLAPAPKPPKAFKDVPMRLVIVEDGGRIGLLERPRAARFLKGTWGFLTALSAQDGDTWDGHAQRMTATKPKQILGRVRHSITHHKIEATVEVWSARAAAKLGETRWMTPDAVEEQLVSNLDRKAWRLYQGSIALTEATKNIKGSRSRRRP